MSLFSILSSKRNNILFISLLVVVTFLAFSPVLKAQFLNWDDDRHLTNNINVLSFDPPHIKNLFKRYTNGIYIPLTSLSFSFENHFFGLNPFVYHLDNLLLHIAVVILVFYFIINLGLKPAEAFLGALIFAIHPTKVESVAWVTERKDVLYSLFYMASLISYQKDKFWLSFIFCVLSMLSKPMALSLPLVMILLDWFNNKGFNLKTIVSKWPHFIAVMAIGYLTYKVHARVPLSHVAQAPLVWVWTFIFYIKKFFVPLFSVPIYILPKPVSFFSLTYIGSLLLFVLLVLGVWLTRKIKVVVFAFAYYMVSIFFLLRFDDATDTNIVADRFLYLPALGFCILTAVGICRLYQFLKTQEAILRYLFTAAGSALFAGLILLTYNQSFVWHDTISLWKHQLKILPHTYAVNNLAMALEALPDYQQSVLDYRAYTDLIAQGANENSIAVDHNKFKKAQELVDLYKEAVAKGGHNLSAYDNLANLYQNMDRFDDALIWYNKALGVDNNNKHVLLGLGLLYQRMNKPKLAIETFNRVLKANPEKEEVYVNVIDAYSKAIASNPQEKGYKEQREEVLSAYEQLSKRKKYTGVDFFNLGFLYEQIGGYEEAIRYYKKALELNPTYEKALFNLANRYQAMGDFKSAVTLYQQLVHYHPSFAKGYLNLGNIYNAIGDGQHARMLYQKTINIDSTNASAYFNLGYLSESAGDLKGALNYYEKAVENDPQLAEGYYNIGNVYAALGQNAEAIASYLKTVGINKNHQSAFVNLSILLFKSRDFPGAIHYLEEAQLLGYNPPAEYLKSLEPYRKSVK